MFIKNLNECEEFTANDGCRIRELLHPENDTVNLPFSIAIATVDATGRSYRHKLNLTEIYYILEGTGRIHIDSECATVKVGDVIVIPAGASQWIENPDDKKLVFAAIVSPPWNAMDDVRLDAEDKMGNVNI